MPKLLRAKSVKRYLRPQKIVGRWTTFNGAMQSALAVPEPYDETRHAEALKVLGLSIHDDLTCVYCGSLAATWDHLENNVKDSRFSGFGHRIYNLVPACRTCNERKGSKPWRVFLASLGRDDESERAARIGAFAARNSAERFGWDHISKEFPELAEEYSMLIREVKAKLGAMDAVAQKIRAGVEERLSPGQGSSGGVRTKDRRAKNSVAVAATSEEG